MPQRAAIRQSAPAEVLTALNLGLNGYTDPTQTNHRMWAAAANVFSGPFGFVQRARWANTINGTSLGTAISISLISNSFESGTQNPIDVVTTATPHGFVVGQMVTIAGASPVTHNGTRTVTAVNSSTQFTVAVSFTGVSNSTVGTAAPGYTAQGGAFTTFKFFAVPGLSSYLLGDNSGKLLAFDSGNNYLPFLRRNIQIDPNLAGSSSLNGPWSREALQNMIYEMNGQVKQMGRGAAAAIIEAWGLDAPDTSPQVVISAGATQNITNIQRTNGTVTVTLAAALTVPGGNGVGMVNVIITSGDTSFVGTFVVLTGSGTATLTWAQTGQNTTLLTPTGSVNVSITKSVGRSYAWAWENANKPHVGAPSPSTQFIAYSAQNGVIQLIQQGTISVPTGSAGTPSTVTGTGTAFTSAWIGRYLYTSGGGTQGVLGRILAVASATSMTVGGFTNTPVSGGVFQIFDPQATHVRLYQTADGGATYFRVQRNALNLTNALATSGLQFNDNANSEPPSFPFTTETSQLNNVPPPVGAFVNEYQGRLVVFGVSGADQSFFYSNLELTQVGLPQESFAPLNQYTLPIQNAKLRGWIEMPGAALIWSDRQDMYRLTGLLTDNTAATAPQLGAQITRLPYNLGCANPFAVDLTPLGAIWVTPQAEVWLYTDHYAPRNIGRPVQDLLNSISPDQMGLIRCKYYHNNTRNWFVIACPTSGATENNTLLILDLDLLAANGSPSFFLFDMAQGQPSWYKFSLTCDSLEALYEPNGRIRLFVGATDLIEDVDFQGGFGTEVAVANASVTLHAWGNDSPFIIKRPSFIRFNTNRDPSLLASDGWTFQVQGIDDDFDTFALPLTLNLTPGVNDSTALSGAASILPFGARWRHSPEMFRIGGVNFVAGKRLRFAVNFPSTAGVLYQLRQIQIGFGPSPPR